MRDSPAPTGWKSVKSKSMALRNFITQEETTRRGEETAGDPSSHINAIVIINKCQNCVHTYVYIRRS